jgi:ADP-heptose:LPS heptosyltransferase
VPAVSSGYQGHEEENMKISDLKKEYENAGEGWLRAAFGSIIRRNFDEIDRMSPDEKRRLIAAIGAPKTYYTELSKELKGVEYDRLHRHIKP